VIQALTKFRESVRVTSLEVLFLLELSHRLLKMRRNFKMQ